MPIRFIITSNRDNAETGKSRVCRFTAEQVRIGSAPACELQLENIAQNAGEVLQTPNGFEWRPDSEINSKINETPCSRVQILRNGDRLQIGEWSLLFLREFEPAKQHPLTQKLASLTAILIATILVAEIGIIAWLPRKIKVHEIWGAEVIRQEIKARIDELRNRLGTVNQEEKSPATLAAQALLRRQLDLLAAYLRQEIDQLEIARLNELRGDLRQMSELADRILTHTLPPPVPELNVGKLMQNLLDKNERHPIANDH